MCIRQASMFNDLRSRLISHGFTNIDYKIINMAEGIFNLKNLEEVSPDIPIYQETHLDKTCQTLGAGKDHFLILDSCNRLVYQVIMPWSFLFYPYVKAAILSAYNDHPCGDCDVADVADEHVTVTVIKHVHLPEIFQATFKPPKEYKHSHKKSQYHKHHHHHHAHPYHHHHHRHHHHHHLPEYHNFMSQGGNEMTVNEQYDTLKQFLSQHLVLVGVGNEAIPVHSQGTQDDYTKYYTVVNGETNTVNTASEHNTHSEVFKDVVVHTDELTKVPEGTDAIRVEQLEGSTVGHETGTVDEFLSPTAPLHQIILWYPHHHIFNGKRQKDHYYIVLNSKNPDYHGHVVPASEEGQVVVGQTFEGEKEHQIGGQTTTTIEDAHQHVAVQTGDATQTGGSTTVINAGGIKTGEHTEHQSGHTYSYNTTHTETHHSSYGSEHTTNELVTGEKTDYHDKTVTGTTIVEGHEVAHGSISGEHTSTAHEGTSEAHREHDKSDTTSQAGTIGHDIHHTGLIHEGSTAQTYTDESVTGAEHKHENVAGTTNDHGSVTHVVTDGTHDTGDHTSHSTSTSDSSAHGDVTHSTSQSSSQTIGGATYSTSFSSSSSSSGGEHHVGDVHKVDTITGGDTVHGQTTAVDETSGSITGQSHHSTTHGDTSHSTSTLDHSAGGQTYTAGTTIGTASHNNSSHTAGSSGGYGQTTGTHITTIHGTDSHTTTGHGSTTYTSGTQGSEHDSTGVSTSHTTIDQTAGSHGTEGHSTSGQTVTGGSSGYSQSSTSHTSYGQTTGTHTTATQAAHGSHSQTTGGYSSNGHSTTGGTVGSEHGHSSDSQSSFGQSSTSGSHTIGGQSSYGQSEISGTHTSGSHTSYGQASGSHTSGSQSSYGHSGTAGSHASGSHSSYSETNDSHKTVSHGFLSGGHSSTGYGQSSGSHSTHGSTSHHGQSGYGSQGHHSQSETVSSIHSGGHGKSHGGYDDRITFRDDEREDLNFPKYLEKYANIKPGHRGFHSRALDEEEPEKSKEGKELIDHYSKILPWIEYPVD